jgi:hypothetical protein
MPLVLSVLSGQLATNFAAPAADAAGCGQQWAEAVKAYASAIVPPVPPPALESAVAALAGALGGAFASPSATGGMESGFAAFGAALAAGMAPAFTGVPPAGLVGFAAQFGGAAPATHGEAAGAIAGRIDAWLKTGTATLVAPPFTTTPWS